VIGAVVPVHNRRVNLQLMLESLARQTYHGFHLVIADDGSTDGTRDLVEAQARRRPWRDRLRWVGCGPHQGVRTGRARNLGVANLEPGTRLLVMLDSDLVLHPAAMALFAAAHARHPHSIVFGLVEGLPPLDLTVVAAAVERGRFHDLRRLIPPTSARVEGTFAGPELRTGLFGRDAPEPVVLDPGWTLPLNSAWPLDLYWKAGGFDETVSGYGYQDMTLGVRASKAGASCVARPELLALHVWHAKPATAMIENQRNLDRYLRQHGAYLRQAGFDRALEADVDWTLWWHYHAERGGAIARQDGRIWAISADRRHRLALPGDGWLPRLGHCVHEPGHPEGYNPANAIDHGVATE
jgi:glycosyltransferase involved in cell wall biosynthesis